MKQSRVEELAHEAQNLTERLVPVLTELACVAQGMNPKAIRGQLQAVEQSIRSLESASVPVPNELTTRHSDLEQRLKDSDRAEQALAAAAGPLQQVFATSRKKTASEVKTGRRRTNRGNISLHDLFAAGLLKDGTEVVHEKKRSGIVFRGQIRQPGLIEIEVNGRTERFDNPSTVGKIVSGINTNGWVYWSVKDAKGSWALLDELRHKLLAAKEDHPR